MQQMAKNKKDSFVNNLSSRKPSDEEIDNLPDDLQKKEQDNTAPQQEGEKGYHIKFPLSHYNKLDAVSKKTYTPKKYIIMQALQEYYENHNH